MGKSFWITSLQKSVKSYNLNLEFIQLHIFGSMCKDVIPKNLDLLLIYNKTEYTIENIICLKNELIQRLSKEYGKPIDITTLTIEEEKEIQFVKSENAIPLFQY